MEPTFGAALERFDDPTAWSVSIEASTHGYDVSLICGALRYGPDGGAWWRPTLNSAQRKGARVLAKHTHALEAKQRRSQRIADASANG